MQLTQFIQVQNNQVTTTSEFIAKAFNKQHKNVLLKIDELLSEIPANFATQNFKEIMIEKNSNLGNGKIQTRAYELTKDGFMLLVMGFTGKAALTLKIAYIEAFNAMAEQIKQLSGSLKPQTTAEQRTPLRQAVSALVGKKHIDYADAYSLIHHRFGVASIEDLTHEQIPQAVEYIHRLILDGEVLDKPKNHTVALPEFELVRIAQYMGQTFESMQLFYELHRALLMLSPHFAKQIRAEVENNLPLLRGIVHHLQDYSGSLKDPFFNEQFAKSMKFLGRITPQCLTFR